MKSSKPVPAIVKMYLKEPDDTGEEFISLSATMYQEGLIYLNPRELRRPPENMSQLELTCTFVDEFAANNWLNNPKVIKYHGKLIAEKLRQEPVIVRYSDVIHEIDNDQTCTCNNPSILLLYGRAYDFSSSLICGDCMNSIPEYKIPKETELENWSRLHKNIYDIWLLSGTLEKWAENQLGDYNSDLNKDARKLLNKLKKSYNVPVYYMIWAESYEEDMNCPNCGKKGHTSVWTKPKKICKRCKLAFGY